MQPPQVGQRLHRGARRQQGGQGLAHGGGGAGVHQHRHAAGPAGQQGRGQLGQVLGQPVAEIMRMVPAQPEGLLDHRGGLGAVHHPPVVVLGMQHLGIEAELVMDAAGLVALDVVQDPVAPEQQLRASAHVHRVQAGQVAGAVDHRAGASSSFTHHLQPRQFVDCPPGHSVRRCSPWAARPRAGP
jgi:hypothetical protein